MDNTSQNDLKDSYLPKKSCQNHSCNMSHISSDHDAGGDEVRSSEYSVNEVVPVDVGSTHQSGAPQANCETTTEDCHSTQDIKCTDKHKQPIPDIQVTIPQSSSSENIEQEAQTALDSPLEGIVVTQKLDSQTASESSHDSDLFNRSVLCYHQGVDEKLEISGCDGEAPDQDWKDLHEVRCATPENDSINVSEVEDSFLLVDTVESPSSLDGRERFSEISDLSQDSNLSCSASNESCKHLLFKTLAASVVDEILELAAKHLFEPETENQVVNAKKSNVNIETIDEQNKEALIEALSENTLDVSENAVKASGEVSNFDKSFDFNSSLDNVSDEIAVNVSNSENLIEPSHYANNSLTSYVESNENPISLMCNGSIVSSNNSIYLDDFILNLSGSENVSNATECGSGVNVKCPVDDGNLNSEAKFSSSNNCSDNWEDLYKSVLEGNFSESEIVGLNLGEKSDAGNASTGVVDTNVWKDNVELSLHDQHLSLEAKIESSKDKFVEADGKSSTIPNGTCLKEYSFCDLEKSKEKTASSGVSPVLSATNLSDSGDLHLYNQEPCMEIGNDLTVPLSNNVDDNTDLKYVNSVNDEIGCNTELSVAKIEDITKEKAVDGLTSNTSFQENAEEKAEKDRVTQEVNTVSNDSVSVPPLEMSEKEELVIGKEGNSVEEVIAVSETAEKEEFIPGKREEFVEVVIPTAETTEKVKLITEKVENFVEKVIAVGETTGKEELTIGKTENSAEEDIATAEISPSNSCHENVEDSVMLICAEEEPESYEVSLEDDVCASIPPLENTKDFTEEEQNFTILFREVTEVPFATQELTEAKSTSNYGSENGHIPLSTMPCQFIVPTVNICPPIMEETYDGNTDDESEISHATSDSESESNMKNVKPVCDGVNTINYKPLLEEDSNDRSTLSLISEMDEASLKEDNLDNEQWEDESASLIMDDSVDRVDQIEKDNLSSTSELVQRVRGQRIRHDKMTDIEVEAHKEEKRQKEDKTNAEYAAKIKDIREALKNDSLERLRVLARSKGGLINDDIRKEAWPRLLSVESSSLSSPLPPINMEDLRAHHEYNQVVLDVNRSLRRFPSKISPEERVKLQNQLTEIILRVLMKRKDLSYYQGYHDVAVTTLLVAGKDAAFHILERISVAHLSDCMLPTMERTIYLLNYIYPLLQRINLNLAERMDRLEIGTIFCLPWFLTWYGYSLNRYEDVVRVFDYFLASPPLAPLYLAAVLVGRRSAEVLAADSDHATVHSLLSRIPETLPLEDLLREAADLYRNYPPDDIEKEVHERCERLRKAQEEEEEQRKRMRQRRMIQRRHSMPTIAARQMPGWYFIDRFLGLPIIQGRRFIQVSATVMFGMIAWHLRNEVYRYF